MQGVQNAPAGYQVVRAQTPTLDTSAVCTGPVCSHCAYATGHRQIFFGRVPNPIMLYDVCLVRCGDKDLKNSVVDGLVERLGYETFVETGVGRGQTIARFLGKFRRLYSIEIDKRLVGACVILLSVHSHLHQ